MQRKRVLNTMINCTIWIKLRSSVSVVRSSPFSLARTSLVSVAVVVVKCLVTSADALRVLELRRRFGRKRSC